jgi:hypothetical protein
VTTPAPPPDPGELPLPAAGVVRTPTTFEAPLGEWGAKVRTACQAVTAILQPDGAVTQAYKRPAEGAPFEFFSVAVRDKLQGLSPVVRTGDYTLTAADLDVLQVFDTAGAVSLFVPADLPGTTGTTRGYAFVQRGAGTVTVRPAQTGVGTISIRATTQYVENSFATGHNITMPTVAATDGIAVLLALASTAKTITHPADFVSRGLIGPSGAGQLLYTKANAPAADSGVAKTWSFNTGAPAVAVAVSLAGAHLTDFIDGLAPVSPDTESDRTADPYTTVAAGVLELSLRAVSSGTTQNAAITPAPTGMTMLGNPATVATDANTQAAAAVAGATVAAGTVIGNREWPTGYGSSRTVGVKPTATDAVKLISDDNAFTSAGPGSFGDVMVSSAGIFVTGRLVP